MMFEPWFVQLTSILSDAIVGLSALAVAIIAFVGLKQWRTELIGRAKFEVAKKMAMLTFEFRDKYKRARNPFTFPGESAGREKGDNETREETELLNEYYARSNRLTPLQDTLQRLYEANWEAEIIIGENIGQLIKPFESQFANLFASIEAYFRAEHNRITRHIPADRREDWLDEHFHRIYGPPDDEISKEIDTSVQRLIDQLKANLR